MKFNEHKIPNFFYTYSFLIKLIHFWNKIILLRNWHVLSTIKETVSVYKIDSFLDIGCGDGQHYFWLNKKYPNRKIYGLDKIEDNTRFCNHHLKNNNCFLGNVENINLPFKVDCILLIGLLDYVEKDELALKSINNALNDNGKLILYCPVNGRKILSVYDWLRTNFNNYEKTQLRQRLYQEKGLLELIEKCGFKVIKKTHTMGSLGILSQEMYASLLILFEKFKLKPLIVLVLYLFSPILFLLNFIDFHTSKSNGNGLILVLEKIN